MVQLALAGIIGPALFTLVVLLLGAVQPEYHGWLDAISVISLGPMGWLQDVNFVMFGMLMAVFTLALYRGVQPGPASLTGLGASLLSALGIIFMGVFPLTRDRVGVVIQTDGHAIASIVAYVGAAAGFIALARLQAADAAWKQLAKFTHRCGMTMALMFPALLAAMPVNSPVHLGVGVLQRAALAVWFTCTIVLALRLRKVLQQRELDEEDDRDLVLSR
jgi:hypothetical membrane protein